MAQPEESNQELVDQTEAAQLADFVSGKAPEAQGLLQSSEQTLLDSYFAEDGHEKPTDNSHLVLKEK